MTPTPALAAALAQRLCERLQVNAALYQDAAARCVGGVVVTRNGNHHSQLDEALKQAAVDCRDAVSAIQSLSSLLAASGSETKAHRYWQALNTWATQMLSTPGFEADGKTVLNEMARVMKTDAGPYAGNSTDITRHGYKEAAETALPDIELVSAKVHEAWIASKLAQGVTSRHAEDGEELIAPYTQLSEKAKELDRGTVRAVYAAIESAQSMPRKEAALTAAPTAEVTPDDCADFLKDGETHRECIERNRRDIDALLTLLVAEKQKSEPTPARPTATCDSHGHLYGGQGLCLFCKTPRMPAAPAEARETLVSLIRTLPDDARAVLYQACRLSSAPCWCGCHVSSFMEPASTPGAEE